MGDAYKILQQDEDVGIAVCGPVFLTMIYGAPTVARIDKIGEQQRKHMKGSKHAVVTVIDPRVGRDIDADARHRAKQLSNEMEPFTISMTFIVLGTGFFASMVRSVIAGVQLFSNQKNPWKVVSDIAGGVAHVQECVAPLGKAVDAQALAQCIARLIGGGPSANAGAADEEKTEKRVGAAGEKAKAT